MAQRLSFDWSESVTIGRAVADWLALRKGEHLGLLEADNTAERAAREETDELPTRIVEIMVRAYSVSYRSSHKQLRHRIYVRAMVCIADTGILESSRHAVCIQVRELQRPSFLRGPTLRLKCWELRAT